MSSSVSVWIDYCITISISIPSDSLLGETLNRVPWHFAWGDSMNFPLGLIQFNFHFKSSVDCFPLLLMEWVTDVFCFLWIMYWTLCRFTFETQTVWLVFQKCYKWLNKMTNTLRYFRFSLKATLIINVSFPSNSKMFKFIVGFCNLWLYMSSYNGVGCISLHFMYSAPS